MKTPDIALSPAQTNNAFPIFNVLKSGPGKEIVDLI